VRPQDLPRLRSWANNSNPLYRDGLAVLAAQVKADMDAGHLPADDSGGADWEQYPNEMYAQLFAFMSLISNDQATRDDYAQRARTLLMYVMDRAALGAASGVPFRDPEFSTYNRSRWWGEGFALTVDWIYPYLSPPDKATIRQVFLRWANENLNASSTDYNHPEPAGVVNDPSLVSDGVQVRWAANNYYMAHMRNIGLMAMALDAADDVNNELRDYLGNATGAWLYVIDHLLRNDGRGGFPSEGFEYGPEALGATTQFLLALHTAGQDDAATWGTQVVFSGNPFWNDMIPAFLHSLSPASLTYDDFSWIGEIYQPAWYGDGQNYWAPDFVGVFGPLGIYDYNTGNSTRLETLRWLQTHTPPGGADWLVQRVSNAEIFRDAILYFMLFDPGASSPADPHAGQPLTLYAPSMGRILARTGWDTNASWFTYFLGWNTIDHQLAEGNQFEFYRQGEWLTKGRVGWDGTNESCTIGRSDYHNTLALQNDPADIEPGHFLHTCQQNGSQWLLNGLNDGQILAHSFGPGYTYALGDATPLYNSPDLNATDITHASRSIVWLQPDHIVVYDRATSQTAGRFKRFWLNLPTQPVIAGRQATMTTAAGQKLFVTTLLPTNATLAVATAETDIGEANAEPMQHRLRVEAPGGPQDTRFLHLLQGANAGTSADPVALVQSSSGTSFAGARFRDIAILFPVDLDAPFTSTSYTVPAGTSTHLITGLTPNGGYDVLTQTTGSDLQVTINPGLTYHTDSGGVLLVGGASTKEDSFIYLPLVLTPQASPQLAGCAVFPADNVWNTPVDTLPVDANSDAYVATIGASTNIHPDFGSFWEGSPIGIPYVDVPGTQPMVPISFDYDEESDPGPYPIPPDAPIEGGPDADGDRHILIVERDNCILYEVFYAWPQDGGSSWQAGSGAIFDLNSHALRPDGWTSADAAGLPILPGLVRYDEVAAGEIRHALRFTARQTRGEYIWPARHEASSLSGTQYPPLGQRFRLKAGFDISGFSPDIQVILRALKTYGMFLADNGSDWYISGAHDPRWNDDLLGELKQLQGSDFEAVDESSLMADPDSGQARSPSH